MSYIHSKSKEIKMLKPIEYEDMPINKLKNLENYAEKLQVLIHVLTKKSGLIDGLIFYKKFVTSKNYIEVLNIINNEENYGIDELRKEEYLVYKNNLIIVFNHWYKEQEEHLEYINKNELLQFFKNE